MGSGRSQSVDATVVFSASRGVIQFRVSRGRSLRRRGRPAQPLGDLAYRGARRETARDLLAIQRLKAPSRAAACPGSKAPFTPNDLQNRARPPVEASRYLDQGQAFLPAFPQSGLLRRGKPSSYAHAAPPPTIESEGVASTGLHHPVTDFLAQPSHGLAVELDAPVELPAAAGE